MSRERSSNIRGEEGTVTWTATSVFNGGGVSVHGCTSTRYLHFDIAACKSVSKYDINAALLSILLFLEPCTNSIETRFQVNRYETNRIIDKIFPLFQSNLAPTTLHFSIVKLNNGVGNSIDTFNVKKIQEIRWLSILIFDML